MTESETDFDSPAPNAAEVQMAAAHYITSSECYDMARREWMPAAAASALIRAARTIAALEPRGARPVAALERK